LWSIFLGFLYQFSPALLWSSGRAAAPGLELPPLAACPGSDRSNGWEKAWNEVQADFQNLILGRMHHRGACMVLVYCTQPYDPPSARPLHNYSTQLIFWLHNSHYTGRKTKFALVKSLWFSKLFLRVGILLSEFHFIVFSGFGVDLWIPFLQFFQTAKWKAPKEALGSHLSINVTFLRPHEPQLSAICCVTFHQMDPSYMICIWSLEVLCPQYFTPLPFRCDKISRKGRVFQSFLLIGLIRKQLRCSKILRIRRKFEV